MAGTAGLDDDQPFHPEPVEQEPDGLDRLEDEVGERCEGETEKGRSRDHRQMSDKKQRNAVMWVFPQFAAQQLLCRVGSTHIQDQQPPRATPQNAVAANFSIRMRPIPNGLPRRCRSLFATNPG